MVQSPATARETELIQSCCKGDIRAFELLYNKHKVKMYNIALRIHNNQMDTEDSLQEAFVKVFNSIKKFEGKSAFSTWLYKIVVNTCLNNLRKRKKHSAASSTDFLENEELEKTKTGSGQPVLKFVLEKEISKLSEVNRTVFILYEIEGFNHNEISEILNIPVGTSKSRLFEAKKTLRDSLKPYYEIYKHEL